MGIPDATENLVPSEGAGRALSQFHERGIRVKMHVWPFGFGEGRIACAKFVALLFVILFEGFFSGPYVLLCSLNCLLHMNIKLLI